jgi:hypothetical protein
MQPLSAQVGQKDSTPTKRTILKREPDFYIYRLVKQNRKITPNTPPYPPYYSLPNTSIVAYDPAKDEYSSAETKQTKRAGATKIVYLQGVDTIFASEQKDIPKETYRNPNNRIIFTHGELKVPSYEKTLINFLDWCSLNAESPFRRDDAKSEFKRIDEAKDNAKEIELMKIRKKAFDIAFNCSDEDMIPHAEFLNIKLMGANGLERDIELVRLDYQKFAEANPKKFVESVNNPKMRTQAMVKKALNDNKLVVDKGVARWKDSGKVIVTIPSDKDRVEFLADFTYTDEGASFAATLKGLHLQ